MQQSEIKEIIKLHVDLITKVIANYKYLEGYGFPRTVMLPFHVKFELRG